MPVCKICNVQFPNHVVIDGKLRNLCNRKRCLTCSPFGKHNTSPVDRLKDRRVFNYTDCEKTCVSCSRPNRVRGKYCGGCYSNQRRFRIKRRAVDYKGGKCIICGYNKCIAALTFHHRDPSTKLFGIAGNHTRSWKVVKEELDKCDLLCSNCHIELEYNK